MKFLLTLFLSCNLANFAIADIHVNYEELTESPINYQHMQQVAQIPKHKRKKMEFTPLPQEIAYMVCMFARNDTEMMFNTPDDIIERYCWDKKWAADTGLDIYYNIQTNYSSFAERYFSDEDVDKERLIWWTLRWLAYLKKDEEIREVLFNSLKNESYSEFIKTSVIADIIEFLPADEVRDYILRVCNGEYGFFDRGIFLSSCAEVYRCNIDKRDGIITGLYDSLEKKIPEKDFPAIEKDIAYFMGRAKNILPKRKSILKRAAAYYEDKPEFENELREVKNRIREIEKQEVKIWFGKWWWSIAFAVVFITGGIVLVVRIRSL